MKIAHRFIGEDKSVPSLHTLSRRDSFTRPGDDVWGIAFNPVMNHGAIIMGISDLGGFQKPPRSDPPQP